MALYENVFIARQDVPTTQVEALTKQFTDLVTAQGGTVSKNEYWGLRSLTFRIKKNRKGHYTLLNIDARGQPRRGPVGCHAAQQREGRSAGRRPRRSRRLVRPSAPP